MNKLKRILIVLFSAALFLIPFNAYGAENITLTNPSIMFMVGSSGYGVTDPVFNGNLNQLPTQFNINSNQITQLQISWRLEGNFVEGDTINLHLTSSLGSVSYSSGNLYIKEENDESNRITAIQYSDYSLSYEVKTSSSYINFHFVSNQIRKSSDSTNPSTRFNLSYQVESADTGLLRNILDFIKTIPTKIGDFFSNLINNLQTLFENVGDWFAELGDKISGFFQDLGNSISGFFEKLWNRIYWGNEEGESEYEPPVFSSGLDEALDQIDGYIAQLDDTNTEIENAKNESVAYVEQGTTVINTIFGVFPSVLTALVVFGVVFIFCRKVVGR